MKTAQIILNHLGGNKFLAMSGAKNLVADTDSLRFSVSGTKNKSNLVSVKINDNDTYTIDFMKFSPKTFDVKIIKSLNGIFIDQLQSTFTAETGLDIRL